MERTIHIKDQLAKTAAENLIRNLPIGGLDVVVRPHKEIRSPSQNSLMWASAISDITEQAWLNGRQYTQQIWHEYLKAQFMPEASNPNLAELVKNTDEYIKWTETPDGSRKCIASTTNLTKKGFSNYIEQVFCFGAELGVLFTAVQR